MAMAGLSQDWGRLAEHALLEGLGAGAALSASGQDWFDATGPVDPPAADYGDTATIGFADMAPQAVLEFKTVAFRVQNGSPRRGTCWIIKRNHEALQRSNGWYIVGVYDQDAAETAVDEFLDRRDAGDTADDIDVLDEDLARVRDALLVVRAVHVDVVDDTISKWDPCPSKTYVDHAARVKWDALIDSSVVQEALP